MKVIFLTHSSDQGHRFRVEQYFPSMRGRGIEPKWQPFLGTLKERLASYESLPSYDVVCIQRRLFSPFEFYHIRKRSKKIKTTIARGSLIRWRWRRTAWRCSCRTARH